jgi:hypothetical protein
MANDSERFATIYAQGPIGFLITRVRGFEIFDARAHICYIPVTREALGLLHLILYFQPAVQGRQ